ncbi:hypothetical protein I4F81_010153 [Pyropia yezoensis]|uniref:Uncharacterized protein n=1 Tax=Pyropia yezoensis TaxID=2788 RepID=A0ACC3CCV8_PYRYE|nr:hypothetical protein I4F81_010153 [Neopyropia yezoensis]
MARGMDKRAVSRLVAAAFKLYKQSTTLRVQSTGLAPDEVETKVDAQLTKQAGYWRATLEETKTMIDYVHEALPLVGGVVRSVDSFEGSPPDDVSPPEVDLVGGGSGAEGSEEADGSSDGEDTQPADRNAPLPPVPGASGRSLRAAKADAAAGGLFPEAAELIKTITRSTADSGRRFDAKQQTKRMSEQTKRIDALSRLVDNHPDNPVFIELLWKVIDGEANEGAGRARGGSAERGYGGSGHSAHAHQAYFFADFWTGKGVTTLCPVAVSVSSG